MGISWDLLRIPWSSYPPWGTKAVAAISLRSATPADDARGGRGAGRVAVGFGECCLQAMGKHRKTIGKW